MNKHTDGFDGAENFKCTQNTHPQKNENNK